MNVPLSVLLACSLALAAIGALGLYSTLRIGWGLLMVLGSAGVTLVTIMTTWP
jgi:hypothetical protein